MSLCLEKVFVQAQRTFLLTSCSYQHIMIFGGESRRPIKHKIQRCCAAACRNDSDGGSGGGFKGTGCRAPRERHCKRKNVPRRRKPLGRKSVIADIMSVRRQVTNEERTLRGASQKTYIAEDRQQRALSPWCMDRQECAPTFPVWEDAGVFSVAAPAGHSPWNGGRPVFFLHMDTSGRDGFSSRLLSIRAGGAKASPASSLFCTSNSRTCGISTKRTCTIENCWNTGAILLRGWHHQFRGVGGIIGNASAAVNITNCYYLDSTDTFYWLHEDGFRPLTQLTAAAHAAVPELSRRITPRRWKIPASRRNTFTRRMNCGMMHLYPTIMPWGEAALTAPGLVGQAPPRLRFAGAGMDADMTPCGTGQKTAPEI